MRHPRFAFSVLAPSSRSARAAAVATAALGLLAATTASAQTLAPSGVSAGGLAVIPGTRLGGSQGTGAYGAVVLGVSPAVSVEASWGRVNQITTSGTDARTYQLDVPSVNLRAHLVGQTSGLDLLIGGGAFVHRLDAAGGNPKETRTVAFFAPGLALRQMVRGPVALELSARTPLTYVRQGELGATPGKRGLTLSPDLRLGVSLLFRRHTAHAESLPISTSEGYVPVQVSPPASEAGATSGAVATEGAERAAASTARRHLTTFYFAAGSSVVGDEYRQVLRTLAGYLTSNPGVQLDLVGYTDRSAAASESQSASIAESRGTAIKELLVRVYNVDASRVSVTAIGSDFDTRNATLARRVDVLARQAR